MLYSGTDPESCITEYTLVYEDKLKQLIQGSLLHSMIFTSDIKAFV